MVFGLPCGRAFGGLFRVFDGGLEGGLLVGFAVGGGAEGLGGAGGGGAAGGGLSCSSATVSFTGTVRPL